MRNPIHSGWSHNRSLLILGLLALLATALPAAADAAPKDQPSPAAAIFEGEPIDLTEGWGEAQACLVSAGGVECFRTIAELDAAEKLLADGAKAVTCSTPLRLYNGTYRTGTVLSVATRGTWLNLSLYGFDNLTSSYKVGSCNIDLASGTSGGGSRYWRCLTAYCLENVMASGWNNVISSAYNK